MRLYILPRLAIFLFAVAIPQGLAQSKTALISTELDFKRDMQLVPCKDANRLKAVVDLFRSAGAGDAEINIDNNKGAKNLVVTKAGRTNEIIVVGAHYDKVDRGCGAIDNWSGIVTLVHLYSTIRNVETEKSFRFIAFDKEESGLVGSGVFVSGIPKPERILYCSMVNLDSFGFAIPQVLVNVSNSKMTDAAKALWAEMKVDLPTASLAGAADADSTSFNKVGIPAITFHGLDNRWQQFIHSTQDNPGNVNVKSVFYGYRLVLPFLAKIDTSDCNTFRKK